MQKICPTNIRFSIESPTRPGRNKKVIFFVYEQHQLSSYGVECLLRPQGVQGAEIHKNLYSLRSSAHSAVKIELIPAPVSSSISCRLSALLL